MKIGAIVRLKGRDNPNMTVRWVREATIGMQFKAVAVTCEWFDVYLHLQQHEFKPETLELVS